MSFDANAEPVRIEYNDSNAFFRTDNILLVCRLIDQKYPDYENVIPTDNPNRLQVDRIDLLGSLRRVNIFANKTSHQVRFKATGSELSISAEDLDFANEARGELSTPNRAVIIQPSSQEVGEDLLMLIMPVMLNSYAG